MKNVIMIGPPGAGKGTQAKRLEAEVRIPHIASGDLLRDIRRQKTPLAQEVKGYMDRGEYVPDTLMNQLVLERLGEPDARAGFVLDGFPRTLPQAEALDRAMAEEGRRLDRVLYITAPPEILLKRIEDRLICPQCHAIYNQVSKPPLQALMCDLCSHALERRTDAEPDIIRTRLAGYIRQTQPLVHYFRVKGILVQLDGARPMQAVESDVDGALGLKGVT